MQSSTEHRSANCTNRIPRLLSCLLLIFTGLTICFYIATMDHRSKTVGTPQAHLRQDNAGLNERQSKRSETQPPKPIELRDAAFREWLAAFPKVAATSPDHGKWLAQGLALAKERRPQMENLIRSDPRRAVAEALRFDEWAALPATIQKEVEKPFSVTGAYTYSPICCEPGTPLQPGAPSFFASLTMADGSRLQAFPYGRRDGIFSKRTLPVQGITLGGLAAMRDGPLQILEADELVAANQLFRPGQADMGRSLATGLNLGKNAAYAVSGGRIHAFGSRQEAEDFDDQMSGLDTMPGPFTASSLLASSGYTSANGSFDLPQARVQAAARSSAWTETKKRVLLIRVNFPDHLEEPVPLKDVQSVMSQSSDMIRSMSYSKTWVECTASANVYTLPNTLEYYSSAPNLLWGQLEVDALNSFRQQKSGTDASINAGLVDPARGELGDYDIVGIYRITATGEGAGGVAGGSGFVIMGSWANTIRVFTHEWGHNYGLGHSSLWKTTDGSVAGAGVTDEYGDPFDLMGDGPMPQGHFHPEGKVRLNWLPSARWADADASISKTYRISRIDNLVEPKNLHGVRITKGTDAAQNGYYWIGHRGAFKDNPRLSKGAYLIWQRPNMNRSWLLDATPNSVGGARDSALAIGTTFSDPLSHAYITPLAAGGSGTESYLDVRVNRGPFPLNTPPVASKISGPVTIDARAPATYTVTGSDANGDTLAYSWEIDDPLPASLPNARILKTRWSVGGRQTLKVVVSDMKGGTVKKNVQVQVNDPLDYWKTGNVGRPVTMSEAQSGNGVIMGMGYWGELFRSSDGIHWSEIDHKTGLLHWTRLAFGNGVFVMSGHRNNETFGRIAYSTDGKKWKMAGVPKRVPFAKAVAHGGGKFVAAGERGTILWSRDGVAWKKTTVPGQPDFHGLAWNGKVWLATARNPNNNWLELVWTSADAVKWTPRQKVGVDGMGIRAHRGAFYYLSWWAGIRRSTDDGLSWHAAVMPSETRWSVTRASVADDGTMVAIGIAQDEPGAPLALLVSVDGLYWHRSTSKGAKSAVAGANNLGFVAGRMLILGNDGVVRYSAKFKSTPVVKLQELATLNDDVAESLNLKTADYSLTRTPEFTFPRESRCKETLHDTWKTLTAKDSVTGLKYLELVVIKTPGEDYRRQIVEVSSNLTDWKSGANHTTIIRDDPWMLKVRDRTPTMPETKRHIRLSGGISGRKR